MLQGEGHVSRCNSGVGGKYVTFLALNVRINIKKNNFSLCELGPPVVTHARSKTLAAMLPFLFKIGETKVRNHSKYLLNYLF